jgi:transcriptional accessory protein Tex/SPT6
MSAGDKAIEPRKLLSARMSVPEGVVYRAFAKETVVLNLETGLYHGLNPTAGRMFAVLDENGSVADTAEILAHEYNRPLVEIQQDLCNLCEVLLHRALLVKEA